MKFGNVNIGGMSLGSIRIGGAKFGNTTVFNSVSEDVEYIETVGTAYLNTGIVQKSRNFELTIRFAWKGSTASDFESFFGYMATGAVTPRSGLHKYQGNWMFGTNTTQSSQVAVDSNIHTIVISGNATTNSEKLFIDGIEIASATTTSVGIFDNSIPFFLGARNRGNSVDNT